MEPNREGFTSGFSLADQQARLPRAAWCAQGLQREPSLLQAYGLQYIGEHPALPAARRTSFPIPFGMQEACRPRSSLVDPLADTPLVPVCALSLPPEQDPRVPPDPTEKLTPYQSSRVEVAAGAVISPPTDTGSASRYNRLGPKTRASDAERNVAAWDPFFHHHHLQTTAFIAVLWTSSSSSTFSLWTPTTLGTLAALFLVPPQNGTLWGHGTKKQRGRRKGGGNGREKGAGEGRRVQRWRDETPRNCHIGATPVDSTPTFADSTSTLRWTRRLARVPGPVDATPHARVSEGTSPSEEAPRWNRRPTPLLALPGARAPMLDPDPNALRCRPQFGAQAALDLTSHLAQSPAPTPGHQPARGLSATRQPKLDCLAPRVSLRALRAHPQRLPAPKCPLASLAWRAHGRVDVPPCRLVLGVIHRYERELLGARASCHKRARTSRRRPLGSSRRPRLRGQARSPSWERLRTPLHPPRTFPAPSLPSGGALPARLAARVDPSRALTRGTRRCACPILVQCPLPRGRLAFQRATVRQLCARTGGYSHRSTRPTVIPRPANGPLAPLDPDSYGWRHPAAALRPRVIFPAHGSVTLVCAGEAYAPGLARKHLVQRPRSPPHALRLAPLAAARPLTPRAASVRAGPFRTRLLRRTTVARLSSQGGALLSARPTARAPRPSRCAAKRPTRTGVPSTRRVWMTLPPCTTASLGAGGAPSTMPYACARLRPHAGPLLVHDAPPARLSARRHRAKLAPVLVHTRLATGPCTLVANLGKLPSPSRGPTHAGARRMHPSVSPALVDAPALPGWGLRDCVAAAESTSIQSDAAATLPSLIFISLSVHLAYRHTPPGCTIALLSASLSHIHAPTPSLGGGCCFQRTALLVHRDLVAAARWHSDRRAQRAPRLPPHVDPHARVLGRYITSEEAPRWNSAGQPPPLPSPLFNDLAVSAPARSPVQHARHLARPRPPRTTHNTVDTKRARNGVQSLLWFVSRIGCVALPLDSTPTPATGCPRPDSPELGQSQLDARALTSRARLARPRHRLVAPEKAPRCQPRTELARLRARLPCLLGGQRMALV
ncbi:hypothetical protein B0H14DRAFT_3906556 [Mycena olivaceomarginata]|nr:hypothetical protein B0H14DRAFT_3906556 [Mycena olivaceomarginata]